MDQSWIDRPSGFTRSVPPAEPPDLRQCVFKFHAPRTGPKPYCTAKPNQEKLRSVASDKEGDGQEALYINSFKRSLRRLMMTQKVRVAPIQAGGHANTKGKGSCLTRLTITRKSIAQWQCTNHGPLAYVYPQFVERVCRFPR